MSDERRGSGGRLSDPAGRSPGSLGRAGSRLTELRNPRSSGIDTMCARELVELISSEDLKVVPAVAAERDKIVDAIELVVGRFRRGGRLIYVGAGTSGRLGVLDAAECPPTFGTDPEMVQGIIAGGYGALVRAREGAEDDPRGGARDVDERDVGPNDVVMGIATSGGTPYVRGALERARELGAATVFLCCTPLTDEDADADTVITPLVGPEVVTGSTRMKAGTATKLVLNTITTSAMILLGKTYGNLMVDLQATCEKLKDRARRIMVETTGVGYDEAGEIIDAAGGSVKVAIVMTRAGVGADEARRMLAEKQGSIARALEQRAG
jgi:N-acetylmuramic acid 6-phosphate etherase